MNLKIRTEFLEAHSYVNGVKDSKGNTVIRPLTKEELEWIHKFECETVIFDFYHHPELRAAKKKLDDKIKELANTLIGLEQQELELLLSKVPKPETGRKNYRRDKIKRRVSALKKGINLEGVREFIVEEKDYPEVLELKNQLHNLQKKYNLYPTKTVQRELYRTNNKRNYDLYALKARSGELINFDIDEYDRFVSEKLDSIDIENLLIDEITKKE